jgi:hypothetical protein
MHPILLFHIVNLSILEIKTFDKSNETHGFFFSKINNFFFLIFENLFKDITYMLFPNPKILNKQNKKHNHRKQQQEWRKSKMKKKLLFKTNKTRNTTIENSNRSEGNDRHSTLEGRQKWL